MVSTRSRGSNDKTDEKGSAAAGEKHEIEHDGETAAPNAKKPKTEEDEHKVKQTSIEESVSKMEDGAKSATKDDEESKEDKAGNEEKKEDQEETESATKKDGETAEQPHGDPDVPSNILEKGIIYFFFRPRVNISDPEEVSDIARSFFLLRPLAPDASLGTGPIGDAGNSRLIALPKKVLPQSGKDRFMSFVEKSHATFQQLKEGFLEGEEYATKTQGTRFTPEAVPAAEGVYVMTTTGRESHLAYVMTLPKDLGEVQKDLGVKEKGSFIISTKNPEFPGPQNAQLPAGPGFPKEILEEFRGLRWLPSKPAHFDYPNAQILLIGESGGIENATETRKKDEKEGKEDPQEVLEEFEHEDVKRMEGLGGSNGDAIFKDLQARADKYPDLKTTFS